VRAAAIFVCLSAACAADTVWLRGGRSIAGKVLSVEADSVRVKDGATETAHPRADVELIEYGDRKTARAGFDRRRAVGTADALVDAARWAALHGLREEAAESVEAALAKDGAHAAAKELEAELRRTRLRDPKQDEAFRAHYGDGWRIHAGERYRLATNVDAKPEDFDHRLVAMIDAFWPTYCDTFGVNPAQQKMHNVVCYATKEQFDAAPDGMVNAYGVYHHGNPFRPAVLWYMQQLRGSSFTTRHECGHQFVAHYVRNDGETWFGEGIATTFECRGDVAFQDHLYRWEVVRREMLEPGGNSLDGLIRGSPKAKSEINYCLGAAAHMFFLEGKDRAYRTAYQLYLRKGDTRSPEALARAVGRPLAELEAEFIEWVKDLDGRRKKKPEPRK
jgi:hypothetical protein